MSVWISSPDIPFGVRIILLLLCLALSRGLARGLAGKFIPQTEPFAETRILPLLLLLLALGGSLSSFFWQLIGSSPLVRNFKLVYKLWTFPGFVCVIFAVLVGTFPSRIDECPWRVQVTVVQQLPTSFVFWSSSSIAGCLASPQWAHNAHKKSVCQS